MNNENSESRLILAFLLGMAIASPLALKALGTGLLTVMAIPLALIGLYFFVQMLMAGIGLLGVVVAFTFQAAIYWTLFFGLMGACIFAGPAAHMDTFLLLSFYVGFPVALLMAGLRVRKGYNFNGPALDQRFKINSTISNQARVALYLSVSAVLSFMGYENFVNSSNYMNSFNGEAPGTTYIAINTMFGGFSFGLFVFLLLPIIRKKALIEVSVPQVAS
jgi:hypothetical protein